MAVRSRFPASRDFNTSTIPVPVSVFFLRFSNGKDWNLAKSSKSVFTGVMLGLPTIMASLTFLFYFSERIIRIKLGLILCRRLPKLVAYSICGLVPI